MTIEDRLISLEEKMIDALELLQISMTSLTTKKSVSKFLNVSEKTIDNYIKNETFILGKHYFINSNNRIEYLPLAILHFRRNPRHKIKIVEPKKEEKIILSETTSKILRGVI